jgi:tetratricopeptide (TPR) repeat protein
MPVQFTRIIELPAGDALGARNYNVVAMPSDEQQIAAHHSAAQKALQKGLLREVHQHCLSILNIDPSFADAWFLCGVIATHNGQIAKSIDILGNAVTLAPDNPEYRAELGKQLLAADQPEQALREAEVALSLEPGGLPTLNTLGTVFSHTGEHEKALHCFEMAVRSLEQRSAGAGGLTNEWRADLYFNTAASQQFVGRFDAAEAAYEKAIALQPKMFKAHASLTALRRATAGDNHLDRLLQLRTAVCNERDQLQLGHAIAKEQEDIGNYEDAFESLQWAKQAWPENLTYNAESDEQLFAGIKQLFTRELPWASYRGCDSHEPIFVVGMPRTGTTLVEQILSSHSQVYAAGELQNFPLQVKRASGINTNEVVSIEALDRSLQLNLENLGYSYIESTRPRTGHTRHFIDKLPLNFLFLGLIRLALPNAKLICLRRDPMDTCLSNYRQMFATDFKHYHYNRNLLDCGRYYIQFDQLMSHWQTIMPGAVHEISYDALVAQPERVARGLLNYCGLEWEDQCLTFHQRKTSVATPSAVQVRQEIYTSSVDRWRRYGDAMQPLYELLKSAGFYS